MCRLFIQHQADRGKGAGSAKSARQYLNMLRGLQVPALPSLKEAPLTGLVVTGLQRRAPKAVKQVLGRRPGRVMFFSGCENSVDRDLYVNVI